MENQFRTIGRPKGGRLNAENLLEAKLRHNEQMRIWKAEHPEAVKQHRASYLERKKTGASTKKSAINILKAFIGDVKNITIV